MGRNSALKGMIALPFDGSLEPVAARGVCTLKSSTKFAFKKGVAGQALLLGKGARLRYALAGMDARQGAVELWVKHKFPPPSEYFVGDTYPFLELLSGRKNTNVKLAHSRNCNGFSLDGPDRTNLQYWVCPAGQWHHLVVTWDTKDDDTPHIQTYRDGKPTPRVGTRKLKCRTRPVAWRELRIGNRTDYPILVDELCVYDKRLNDEEVKCLHKKAGQGVRKLASFTALHRQRLADEAKTRACEKKRIRKMRVGLIAKKKGGSSKKVRDILERYGFPYEEVLENEFHTKDLSPYSHVFLTGGGGWYLPKAGIEAIQRFVRKGGGYIGICVGAHWAQKHLNGTLRLTRRQHWQCGFAELELMPHPVTKGFSPNSYHYVAHYNGNLFVPRKKMEIIAYYRTGRTREYAAIFSYRYGKGRVLLTTPHPELGGRDSEPRPIIRNALLYTAQG